ncbi:U32 family peptidase [Candidatus Peregrinibacteria bacterium]|nr:U32 family peptidase [Candidatus Peregrinibacteria bacterium]MBT4148161.1 U32 family peptidase [Candidatus Peregrinibacteria bacterium]MBT4366648.1 U32 family peptidase [Candidatus Peregrinibacteria bacterium]MBT4455635.1 U32 family peptidase [Candidatus Peregrinibacteria bacterium]
MDKRNDAPELLLPAGDAEKLEFALKYGADAVYMGTGPFSMRSRFNNFTEESFLEGARKVRESGKKLYVTVNIHVRNNKIDAFKKHFEFLRDKVKPDALIIADTGLIQLAREVYPDAVLHLSVQANALNYKAVEFWRDQGVARVILPRELMLDEIAEIHAKVPDMELEAFVHGAICVAYSGRCLLSAYMTGRDANQGICAHSCRWKYKVRSGSDEFFLEEEKRPGEFMPIEEDEHGTYIMNSRDNCLIEYLNKLREVGICSFKIEGRNKTIYYLSVVAKAYRKAIDDMMAGLEFDPAGLDELNRIANRGYIPGFMKGFPGSGNVKLDAQSEDQVCKFIGVIREVGSKGDDDLYRIEVRNRVEVGDEIEVVVPPAKGADGENVKVKIGEMISLNDEKVDAAHGGDKDVYFRLEKGLPEGGLLRIYMS